MTRSNVSAKSIFLVVALLCSVASPAAAPSKPVAILPGEIEAVNSLRQRETAAAAREKELAAREEMITALEKEVEDKLARLTELQKDVQEKLAELKQVEDSNFRSLVKVYSSMKPASVALILNEMEDDAAVRVLRAIKTETTAKILPKLDRDKAVRISKQLGMIE